MFGFIIEPIPSICLSSWDQHKSPEGREIQMSKKRINNHSKKANLQLFFNEIIRSLDEIDHIRAHIHRISFTTNYPYKMIAEKLGTEFQIKAISKRSKSSSSIYKFEGYTNFLDFKVHVMTGLIESMIKKTDRFSRITIVPKVPINPRRHRSMICKLHNRFKFGFVKVSEVELAVDLMHISPRAVRRTFQSILKIIYVSYITDSNKIRFDGHQAQLGKKLNAVLKLGDKSKVYERGDDKDKIPEEYDKKGRLATISGWPYEVLDRVRLEKTMKRRELKGIEVDSLSDLAHYRDGAGNNIMQKFLNHFQFRYIVRGPLQANYTCLMRTVVNLPRKANYVLQIKKLKIRKLKRRIRKAVERHNSRWFRKKVLKKTPVRKIRRRLKKPALNTRSM